MSQKTEKRGQPRKRPVAAMRSRRVWIGIAAALATAAVGGGVWAWKTGQVNRIARAAEQRVAVAAAKRGLVVRDVLVSGRHETTRAALLSAVDVRRGAPILDVDVDAARERVEHLPWVRTASVRRVLPDTIVVDVVERRALALWQEHGKFHLIDHDGRVIADRNVGRFDKLLVVVGKDAPAHAADLLEILDSQPTLRRRVKAAVWVGDRRWNVQFDNGIDVRLPEGDTAGAWRRLAEYEKTHQVLARDVRILDMRLPDRLIIRKPDKAPHTHAPAKIGGRET